MEMLRNSALILLPIALVACSQPRYVVRAGLDSITPALAGATGPLPLIPGQHTSQSGPVSSAAKGRSDRKATGGHPSQRVNEKAPDEQTAYPDTRKKSVGAGAVVDRLPAGVVQAADKSFGTSQTMSMVPASGDQRSRLLRSATRLVGIMKSFDSRSFLGHLLAICDLLPAGRISVDWSSRDQIEQARAAGMFREAPGNASPGDIVFFKCQSGCGADAIDGIGAGVVVDTEAGRTVFIAYRNGQVDRFDADGDELIGYCAP